MDGWCKVEEEEKEEVSNQGIKHEGVYITLELSPRASKHVLPFVWTTSPFPLRRTKRSGAWRASMPYIRWCGPVYSDVMMTLSQTRACCFPFSSNKWVMFYYHYYCYLLQGHHLLRAWSIAASALLSITGWHVNRCYCYVCMWSNIDILYCLCQKSTIGIHVC